MKRNNRKRATSRRKTPWDNIPSLTPSQSFIKEKYLEHYYYHHPSIHSSGETELFAHYAPPNCPRCGSTNFIKKSHYLNGLQRYLCKDCNSYFSITTGTLLEDHKIPISEWIEFILSIISFNNYEQAAKANKNSSTTIKYWTKKLFVLLEDYQDGIILEGDVYIDEFYYRVKESSIAKDAKGRNLRGLSTNQYCIGVGYDGQRVYLHLEGKAKTSRPKTRQAFIEHIKPGSCLIHDDEKAHDILVDELNLQSKVYPSKDTKGLNDKDNPMDPINKICKGLNDFLNSHSGFNRLELADYLNLYSFIKCEPNDPLIKVDEVIKMILNSRKIVRYRDYFSKKH